MERKYVGETITDATRDARNRYKIKTGTEDSDTERHRTPPHTGSDCVKIRNYRAAIVCLVLLCVLQLTVVIALGVTLHDMIEEFHIENKKHFDENHELKANKSNWEKYIQEISNNNTQLTRQKQDLQNKMNEMWQQISKMDGWKCSQSSLYYVSSEKEKKSWTESKRDCTERGADLVIIDNKQEQDFVKKVSGVSEVWIGLTKVEGTWKWVDGSTQADPGFWVSGKPGDSSAKDCAVNLPSGFADYSCDTSTKWICEKKN